MRKHPINIKEYNSDKLSVKTRRKLEDNFYYKILLDKELIVFYTVKEVEDEFDALIKGISGES